MQKYFIKGCRFNTFQKYFQMLQSDDKIFLFNIIFWKFYFIQEKVTVIFLSKWTEFYEPLPVRQYLIKTVRFSPVHCTCTHGQNFPFGFLGPRNLDPRLHTEARFSPWTYPATYPDRTQRGDLYIWWRRKSRK